VTRLFAVGSNAPRTEHDPVFLRCSGAASKSLELYYAQLGLNLLWTPLFFAFHRKGLALIDILALTGTAAWWTKSLFDLGPVAFGNYNINPGWLGVPYMLWLSTGT